MSRETLVAELNRLLDVGEPLLTLFLKQFMDGWALQLPDNISPEMRRCAFSVAYRAKDRRRYRRRYQDLIQRETNDYLAERVEEAKAGLLGWRSIGVLR